MIAWLFETLVATTLLMAAVLLLRAPVRKTFGPNVAYALWLIPVARMLMPPMPGDWQLSRLLAPLLQRAEEAPVTIAGVAEIAHAAPAATFVPLDGAQPVVALVAPVATAPSGPGLFPLLIGLWAIGALGFLGYHLISHTRFCRRLLKRSRTIKPVADGKVWMVESDAASGPLAFGIWRKYVAFPRDFNERYDPLERNLALAHELGHHARGDLVANWVALVMLAIHWFNPVAWRAFRAFRADQEMACDALVLADRAPSLRHAYGRAIVKSAHGGAVSAACHLHTINEIKGRLRMLSVHTKLSRSRIAGGVAGTAMVAALGLGLTASGSQAAERISTVVEARIGVDFADLDAKAVAAARTLASVGQTPPAPPPAPSAPAAPAAPATPAVPDSADAPLPPEPPVAPGTPHAGQRVHREVRVVTMDGGTRVYRTRRAPGVPPVPGVPSAADIERMIPDVRNERCGNPGNPEIVQHRDTRNGRERRVMIICTDRVERVAARAADAHRVAIDVTRHALAGAMAGIQAARASIQADRNLSPEAKRDALRGLDDAMRELRSEMRTPPAPPAPPTPPAPDSD